VNAHDDVNGMSSEHCRDSYEMLCQRYLADMNTRDVTDQTLGQQVVLRQSAAQRLVAFNVELSANVMTRHCTCS